MRDLKAVVLRAVKPVSLVKQDLLDLSTYRKQKTDVTKYTPILALDSNTEDLRVF